ncbi:MULTISPECIES: glycosyltransferase family 4 protein [Acidiferrobacter]|jgi:glycosyltransferase involved in cell wall biosynthesis|uniref:Glycosyltransferase family 1 protein n=1 Tax=Acidiferrobacter thiooxydans TaxID=163359 RepID=A0A368HIS0_9GAMM|nr:MULTISPECIES: glycosyltransferase family 1 protein [Acidiferrobacter]AWP23051.1 glycosyltransferase family 1 protein [Acidiferrobacter sp. SPIII_3]MDA8191738.1 glycosyltransferase family 1 protein [Gammaproteobacteria bacterium]RCN59264.1 glycosyltransferase family 1 protein [Acidiferrobacter thiooxydans]
MPLIVAVDATGLGRVKTGTAVYVLEILRIWNEDKHLTAHFHVFVSPKTKHYFDELSLDSRFEYHFAPDGRGVRSLWQHLVLPFAVARVRCDVHWGATFVVPVLSRCPCVVTVHDMTFQTLPAVHERVKRWYFGTVIGWSLAKARVALAISETTKADIARLYPAIAQKIRVTLLGPRAFGGEVVGRLAADGSPEPYVLAIGTLEPRKNLPRLLRAWCALAPAIRGRTRLYVAGPDGWMMGELSARETQEAYGVQFLGYFEEARLRELLQGAMLLAYPSLYEGFGLPVIEAMSVGVPVLTSGVGATAEVAGDAAYLVDPLDQESIRTGLERLLKDPGLRETLSARGRARAATFSWRRTAELTFQALEEVARRS